MIPEKYKLYYSFKCQLTRTAKLWSCASFFNKNPAVAIKACPV